MFRIRKRGNGHIVFTLSGRIEGDDLGEIQRHLAESGSGKVILDWSTL